MSETLLLHACCAPCLTSVDERLRPEYENIDVLWFNPNIEPLEEYERRLEEIRRFTTRIGRRLIEIPATPEARQRWEAAVVDYSHLPEGSRRCRECILFRLREALEYAKTHGYSVAGTTLTVSRQKNASMINTISNELSQELGVPYLEADFKKQNGNLRSLELSQEYGLYRQTYCGCRFSLAEAKKRKSTALTG
jgi:hypothetical protein